MNLEPFVPWPGRAAVRLAMLTVGLLSVRTEAAPVDEGPVRAYALPTPVSARIDAVALTVLDDEASQPVADAEVRIRNEVDRRTYVFRTDSRGRLRFECASRRDEPMGSIEVRKDGYVPLGESWGYGEGQDPPKVLTLRLRRGTTMGGIVVAAADRPVEGVIVVMTVTRYGPGRRSPNPIGHEFFNEIPLRTGPDGRWRTDSVPPGAEEVHLQLIHPDFVSDARTISSWPAWSPKVASLRDQSNRQVLRRGLRVEGHVVDDQGRPIAGARIDDAMRGLVSLEHAWCNPSDAEGRFHIHLPQLPSGRNLLLTARAKGYAPLSQEVAADPDHPVIEFRLSLGKRLRVRVVDPWGDPIPGALISITGYLPGDRGIRSTAWTDQNGHVEWDDMTGHPLLANIQARGYLHPEPIQVTATDKDVTIPLQPAVDARLRAVDARTGEAIPRFRIRIGRQEPGTKGFRWGPPTGRSAPRTFDVLLESAKGPYQFEISAAGYEPSNVLVPAEQTILRDAIRLEKARK